jgi:hypothetical protein
MAYEATRFSAIHRNFFSNLAFAKPGRIFARDTAPDATDDSTNDLWRTFEVTTRAEVLKPSGAAFGYLRRSSANLPLRKPSPLRSNLAPALRK